MARYDLESVVGGRIACSDSCGNMMARGVSAAGTVQQREDCNEVKALPAGAVALVVLVKEPVLADASIQRAGIEVVGDASRSAGVAGNGIAIRAVNTGCTRWQKERDGVGEEESGGPVSVECRSRERPMRETSQVPDARSAWLGSCLLCHTRDHSLCPGVRPARSVTLP
jgi:hypothetical protein